jgi:SAM-dependent methyltransferase
MTRPEKYSFTRYLASKKSVDDRALNRGVWDQLARALPPSTPEGRLRVLEVGAGIGTMLTRMVEWGLLAYADYTALDLQPENIAVARHQMPEWAESLELNVSAPSGDRIEFTGSGLRISLKLIADDLYHFLDEGAGTSTWDLLVAHAFLDLVDLPTTVPPLLSTLGDEGLFYFSLNFDGVSMFEPVIDAGLDSQIISLYHRSMDERGVNGKPSGNSRTGRLLFTQLKNAGAQILAAGSSDWIVYPQSGGYPGDEAYFLHFIIETIHQELKGDPQLDSRQFSSWIEKRHAQIERGELIYIAHQLDFAGMVRDSTAVVK